MRQLTLIYTSRYSDNMSARLKLKLLIKAFAVSVWLISGLASSNVYVSALDMNHHQNMFGNCPSVCSASQNSGIKQETILAQNEKDIPVPPPDVPYYVQFQTVGFTPPSIPRDLITNSSFRPPNLNILNSSFKF